MILSVVSVFAHCFIYFWSILVNIIFIWLAYTLWEIQFFSTMLHVYVSTCTNFLSDFTKFSFTVVLYHVSPYSCCRVCATYPIGVANFPGPVGVASVHSRYWKQYIYTYCTIVGTEVASSMIGWCIQLCENHKLWSDTLSLLF